jgi:hypothetical protein
VCPRVTRPPVDARDACAVDDRVVDRAERDLNSKTGIRIFRRRERAANPSREARHERVRELAAEPA